MQGRKIMLGNFLLIGNKGETIVFEHQANNFEFRIEEDSTKNTGDYLINPKGNTTEIIIYNVDEHQIINLEPLGLGSSYIGKQKFLDFVCRPVAGRFVIEGCVSIFR